MTPGTKKILKLLALPAGIFLLYILALVFEIHSALKTHQPVLTKDYYRIGIDYDKYKKEQNSGNRDVKGVLFSEENAGLREGENKAVLIRYVDTQKESELLSDVPVEITIVRPATVNQNRTYRCVTDPKGECKVDITIPARGEWELHVKAKDAGGSFSKMRKLYFPLS